jgi:hypothetical protein
VRCLSSETAKQRRDFYDLTLRSLPAVFDTLVVLGAEAEERLRNIDTGAVIEKTFRVGEKLESVVSVKSRRPRA